MVTYLVDGETTAIFVVGPQWSGRWFAENSRAPLCAQLISRESFVKSPTKENLVSEAVGHTKGEKLVCSRRLVGSCIERYVELRDEVAKRSFEVLSLRSAWTPVLALPRRLREPGGMRWKNVKCRATREEQ